MAERKKYCPMCDKSLPNDIRPSTNVNYMTASFGGMGGRSWGGGGTTRRESRSLQVGPSDHAYYKCPSCRRTFNKPILR